MPVCAVSASEVQTNFTCSLAGVFSEQHHLLAAAVLIMGLQASDLAAGRSPR